MRAPGLGALVQRLHGLVPGLRVQARLGDPGSLDLLAATRAVTSARGAVLSVAAEPVEPFGVALYADFTASEDDWASQRDRWASPAG